MLTKIKCGNKLEKLKEYSNLENMTPERLMQFKGFDGYTSEEAQLIIDEFEKLARIIYRHIRIKHKV